VQRVLLVTSATSTSNQPSNDPQAYW